MMKNSIYVLKSVLVLMCVVLLISAGCSQQAVEEIKPKEEVDVTVSLADGREESTKESDISVLPNVTGKWIGEAQDILDELGLEYEIEWEYVNNVDTNRVISQSPNEGTEIEQGMSVKLIACGEKKNNKRY